MEGALFVPGWKRKRASFICFDATPAAVIERAFVGYISVRHHSNHAYGEPLAPTPLVSLPMPSLCFYQRNMPCRFLPPLRGVYPVCWSSPTSGLHSGYSAALLQHLFIFVTARSAFRCRSFPTALIYFVTARSASSFLCSSYQHLFIVVAARSASSMSSSSPTGSSPSPSMFSLLFRNSKQGKIKTISMSSASNQSSHSK